ncbi:Uu.00g112780.m01.CDS01 [Anthostomella pinea]|uniref:Uu.00g112780.m01.CDS01 n=1 Tax=Anthostomella pinea TaxID=933095 RepID=A0AAI8YGH0_9PEZI|nr:Uu.00g112780.m01.CDS01 [Anthostomella pinea]
MAGRINRITMFKIPEPEGQQKMLDAYKTLSMDQKKDGAPYILSMTTSRVMDDSRSQGWTVVSQAEFASIDDMRCMHYRESLNSNKIAKMSVDYDEECEAHGALKAKAKTMGIAGGPQGVMTVYFPANGGS